MDGRQRIARCCDYEKIIIIFDFFTPPQVLHFRRGFVYLKLNFYELYVQNIVHIEYKLGEEKVMEAITYTAARQNMAKLMDEVVNNFL